MYRLRLLGTASIEDSDGLVSGRGAQGRRLALLALLALARGRVLSRDKLIGILWPEATPERARPQLSDALYVVRHRLGEDVVRSTGDGLALNTAAITSDVEQFERLLREKRPEEAVALYGGPLLDGFHIPDSAEFENWLDAERATLDRHFAQALETLAESAEADSDTAAAVAWWRRCAAHDPVNGRIALRLMQALDAAGDRAAAIQHARIYAALVSDELDAEPDPEVLALAERLKHEPQAHPPRRPDRPVAAPIPPALAPTPILPTLPAPAPVAALPGTPADAAPVAGATASPAPDARRRRPERVLVGAVVLLLVLASATVYALTRRSTPDTARSVGVLPFVNMSADPTSTYFSDGLSEQIILALSRIEGLDVAARTSSFALRDRALGVRAIGDTLGVQAVLEGSVIVDGDRLRVTAQLIDTRTGYHIWAEQYDGDLRNIFTVQDSIATAIAGALHLSLAGSTAPSTARGTPDLAAYDLYLRGLYLRNSLSADALAQAGAYFDSVIALEPRFALAWAAKASILAPQAYFRYANRDSIATEMRRHAERALALDPTLGEAHAALGVLKIFLDWDWEGGGAALERAVALNPNDVHAWHHLGNYYSITGWIDKALAARERALQLDPLNARTLIVLSSDYTLAGRFEQALEQARRAAQLDPVHPLLLGRGPGLPAGEAEILLYLGRLDEAVEQYLRVATLRGATRAELDAMRTAYAEHGMPAFWRAWLQMDLRQSGTSPDPIRMASTYSHIGDTATAALWLQRAYDERNPGLVWLKRERDLEVLREHPRVTRIMQAMKFPD